MNHKKWFLTVALTTAFSFCSAAAMAWDKETNPRSHGWQHPSSVNHQVSDRRAVTERQGVQHKRQPVAGCNIYQRRDANPCRVQGPSQNSGYAGGYHSSRSIVHIHHHPQPVRSYRQPSPRVVHHHYYVQPRPSAQVTHKISARDAGIALGVLGGAAILHHSLR